MSSTIEKAIQQNGLQIFQLQCFNIENHIFLCYFIDLHLKWKIHVSLDQA
jgi:hypothetical protein